MRNFYIQLCFALFTLICFGIIPGVAQADPAAKLTELEVSLKGNKCMQWEPAVTALMAVSAELFQGDETVEKLNDNQKKWLELSEGFVDRKDLGSKQKVTITGEIFSAGLIGQELKKSLMAAARKGEIKGLKMGKEVELPFPEHLVRMTMLSELDRSKMPKTIKDSLFKRILDTIEVQDFPIQSLTIGMMRRHHTNGKPMAVFYEAVIRWIKSGKYPANRLSVESLHHIWPEDETIQTWLNEQAPALHKRAKAKAAATKKKIGDTLDFQKPPDAFVKNYLSTIKDPNFQHLGELDEPFLAVFNFIRKKGYDSLTLSPEDLKALQTLLPNLDGSTFSAALWLGMAQPANDREVFLRQNADLIVKKCTDIRKQNYYLADYAGHHIHDLLLLAYLNDLTLNPDSIARLKVFAIYKPTRQLMRDKQLVRSLVPKAGKVFINRVVAVSLLARQAKDPLELLKNANMGYLARTMTTSPKSSDMPAYAECFSFGAFSDPELAAVPAELIAKGKAPIQKLTLANVYPASKFAKAFVNSPAILKDRLYTFIEGHWNHNGWTKLNNPSVTKEILKRIVHKPRVGELYGNLLVDLYINHHNDPKAAKVILQPRIESSFGDATAKRKLLHSLDWYQWLSLAPEHESIENMKTWLTDETTKGVRGKDYFLWLIDTAKLKGASSKFPMASYLELIESKYAKNALYGLSRFVQHQPIASKNFRSLDWLLGSPVLGLAGRKVNEAETRKVVALLGLVDRVWWKESKHGSILPGSVMVPEGTSPILF